jgi:hypothetical protein
VPVLRLSFVTSRPLSCAQRVAVARVEVPIGVDVLDVAIGRLGGDEEPLGDCAGGEAVGDEARAYDPRTSGPWKDTTAMKQGMTPYSEEFIDCLVDVAQYVYDTYGRFPNTFTTMVLSGFVQAVHIDTDFYDTHYQPGAYLDTHAHHMENWHGDD